MNNHFFMIRVHWWLLKPKALCAFSQRCSVRSTSGHSNIKHQRFSLWWCFVVYWKLLWRCLPADTNWNLKMESWRTEHGLLFSTWLLRVVKVSEQVECHIKWVLFFFFGRYFLDWVKPPQRNHTDFSICNVLQVTLNSWIDFLKSFWNTAYPCLCISGKWSNFHKSSECKLLENLT